MIIYDCEVFKYNWLFVMADTRTKEVTCIWDDKDALEKYISTRKDEVWTGYNNKHYDKYIKKAILCDFDPYEVSKYIIEDGKDGWTYSGLFSSCNTGVEYDVKTIVDPSLKVFEGMLGDNIKESDVDFKIDRPLTEDEKKETEFYCKHDVDETAEVFMQRYSDFFTITYFVNHFELPLSYVSKTKAQLTAYLLGGNSKGQGFKDEFEFPINDCIQLKKYKYIMDWYKNPDNHDYTKKQEATVWGCPHTYAWGGGHGAIKHYIKEGVFVHIDVTAYYPSQQQIYKFGKRVMDKWENFEYIHNSNIEFKRKGDKKARKPFKILDNAVSGQLKQKSSTLFDPQSNNAICINGQLMLLDLVEHIEAALSETCILVQNNTDGIWIQMFDYNNDYDKLDDIVYEWEQRTGLSMEIDTIIGKCWQKDVNNYLICDTNDGSYEAKGDYVKDRENLKYNYAIVTKALQQYMINNTPISETISNCNDMREFQKIDHIGGKYSCIMHGNKVLNEKTVRWYASKDKNDGCLYKKSIRTGNLEKISGCGEHVKLVNEDVKGMEVPNWVDREFYIRMAEDRLGAFVK